MRKIVSAAAGLAFFASPLAAEHLYSGYAQQELYGIERQSTARSPLASPDAAVGFYRWTRPGRRDGPRTGLDRPYGGHGVPYRTPPQGWPEKHH